MTAMIDNPVSTKIGSNFFSEISYSKALFILFSALPVLFASIPKQIACSDDAWVMKITFIFSWDNLPKARLAVEADLYLVWSQWMKDEMRDYYPEISEEKVKLVGTPQFEFYLDNI